MERLKAAIIGLGHQAVEDHIPGIRDSRFARLEAICDIDERKLKEWEGKLGVPGFTDYVEMMDSVDLDFVIAVVPHNAYRGIIEEASRRGIHILKEKPFACNLEEAVYFKELCEKNGVELMVTLQRRFNPIYTTFFQLRDQIGEPFFVDVRYHFFVENPHEGWRGKRSTAGGGCIIDMGYHMVDMIIWYFGLPNRVCAEYSAKAKPEEDYDAEDTAVVLFSYDNGLYGSIFLSRYCPPKTERIKVLGSRGIIELERGKIRRLGSNGEVVESLVREHSWPVAAANQIDYFCRVIRGERENIGSPEYHLQHVSFIDACYLSKEKGMYINPKELLRKYGV